MWKRFLLLCSLVCLLLSSSGCGGTKDKDLYKDKDRPRAADSDSK